ncbi:MAG: hypothetical protein QM751_13355 [Paludibacteraceae bacterium]
MKQGTAVLILRHRGFLFFIRRKYKLTRKNKTSDLGTDDFQSSKKNTMRDL